MMTIIDELSFMKVNKNSLKAFSECSKKRKSIGDKEDLSASGQVLSFEKTFTLGHSSLFYTQIILQ